MTLNPATLARVQFAFTVSFHIIFPTMSIGLAMFLAVIEGLWLKTKDELYLQIYRFWLSIFAMGFGVGVVTGIVLSFEFGLGFARFAQLAGPAIGPMIALQVLTSFFLEAGFLGIMLFGVHRVGPKLHYFAIPSSLTGYFAARRRRRGGTDEYTEKAVPVVRRNLHELIDRLCLGHAFTTNCFTAPLMGQRTTALSMRCLQRESRFTNDDVRVWSIRRR
jgi:hypothetical protein